MKAGAAGGAGSQQVLTETCREERRALCKADGRTASSQAQQGNVWQLGSHWDPSLDQAKGTDAVSLGEADGLVFQAKKTSCQQSTLKGKLQGLNWLFRDDKELLARLEELTQDKTKLGMFLVLTKEWEPGTWGCRWRTVAERGQGEGTLYRQRK